MNRQHRDTVFTTNFHKMCKIKIKCHDFLPPSSWGSPVTSDYAHAQSCNKHPLAHILGTCALIFSSLQFTPTASQPSPGDTPPERGPKEHRNKAKTQSSTHACTMALRSFLSFIVAAQGHLHAIYPTSPRCTQCPLTDFRHQHPSNYTVLIHSFHMPKQSQYSLSCSTC